MPRPGSPWAAWPLRPLPFPFSWGDSASCPLLSLSQAFPFLPSCGAVKSWNLEPGVLGLNLGSALPSMCPVAVVLSLGFSTCTVGMSVSPAAWGCCGDGMG